MGALKFSKVNVLLVLMFVSFITGLGETLLSSNFHDSLSAHVRSDDAKDKIFHQARAILKSDQSDEPSENKKPRSSNRSQSQSSPSRHPEIRDAPSHSPKILAEREHQPDRRPETGSDGAPSSSEWGSESSSSRPLSASKKTSRPTRGPQHGSGTTHLPPSASWQDNSNSNTPYPLSSYRENSSLSASASASSPPFTNCGGLVNVTTMPIRIQSPGWKEGRNYPPHCKCIWKVIAGLVNLSRPTIRIKIKHLEIEQDQPNCPFDHLEIRGKKKLCGLIRDEELVVNSSVVAIIFNTDNVAEYRGFDIELSVVDETCAPEVLAISQGEITSPNFPSNYPDQADCWTLLNANTSTGGQRHVSISLTIDFLDIEPDEECRFDFVEFFEADQQTMRPSKSLGRFCDAASLIRSIDSTPDSRIAASSESSSSQEGQKVTLRASGPYLFIHFKSDQLLNSRGFKATYKVEASLSRSTSSKCSWAPNEREHIITSPNFPRNYPPKIDCTIVLESPNLSDNILLIFENFTMENDLNCTFDRFEIYDDSADHGQDFTDGEVIAENARIHSGSTTSSEQSTFAMAKKPTKVYCGHKSSKFKFISSGPKILLRFFSDEYGEFSGFKLVYKFLPSSPQGTTNDFVNRFSDFEEAPNNASILAGSSHLLHCVPRGFPSGSASKEKKNRNVVWFRENQLITEGLTDNGTKLLIKEFAASHEGRYTCKFGDIQREAWLTMVNPRECKIVFRKRPKDFILSEGDTGILECDAQDNTNLRRRPLITWLKDGKKILPDSRINELPNGYLVITSASRNDTGHYICVARLQENPNCITHAASRVDVNVRANIDDICGQPIKAQPSKLKPNLDSAGKIVGGVDAQKGAFPWQVMFWDVARKSFCGGALLNERWIATAAHCFTPNAASPVLPSTDAILVRLGKYDQKEQESHEIVTKIEEIRKHPEYNAETFDNDIALVRVADHIIFNDYIKPVCIGKAKQSIEENFFNLERSVKMGHVTGWGQLKENGPQPRFLQEIRMPLVDHKTCRSSTSFRVTSNMFCAGYAQEVIGDACKGDSGGPFVGQSGNRWFLLGVVSWGEGCGRSGKYGFYTKVSNYIEWIRGYMIS